VSKVSVEYWGKERALAEGETDLQCLQNEEQESIFSVSKVSLDYWGKERALAEKE